MELDFNQGTFKIFNEKKEEIATADNLKGKTVVPFCGVYYVGTKATITE